MSDVPFVDTAKETVEQTKQQARQLLSWLPDPYICDECGEMCKAETTYDHRTAAFNGGACPSWYCENCEEHYYREEPWH